MDKRILLSAVAIIIVAILLLLVLPQSPPKTTSPRIEEPPQKSLPAPNEPNVTESEETPEPLQLTEPEPKPTKQYTDFKRLGVWKSQVPFFEMWVPNGYRFTGDFNGDGKDDLFTYNSNRGFVSVASGEDVYDWEIWVSSGDGFEDRITHSFDRLSLAGAYSGDFNGDGLEDIFDYGTYGSGKVGWFVYPNKEGEFWDIELWRPETPLPNPNRGIDLSGDFNGDGRMDVFTYTTIGPEALNWLVYPSNGTAFEDSQVWSEEILELGYVYSNYVGVADFNGDGNDDIFYYSTRAGDEQYDWQVAISTGSSFKPLTTWKDNQIFGKVGFMADEFYFYFCDFNADEKADLFYISKFANDPARGDWQVSLSTGDSFSPLRTWLEGEEMGIEMADRTNLWPRTLFKCADLTGDSLDEVLVVWNDEDARSNTSEYYDFIVFGVV